jgi:hypothetical protein
VYVLTDRPAPLGGVVAGVLMSGVSLQRSAMAGPKKKKVWFRIVLNEGGDAGADHDDDDAEDAWVVAVDPAGLRLTLVSVV